jgi:uncharacterized protein involved in outer membrane biogenesis
MMPETVGTTQGMLRRLGRVLIRSIAIVCLVAASVFLVLVIYLPTPLAARQVSHFLSDYLHVPVTIAGLRFSGGILSAREITLSSPADFAERDLATASLVKIKPDWLALLSGKKDFAEIAITGLRVALARGGTGEWNFRDLARFPATRKGEGGGETFLRRLTVSDASLSLNGVSINHLSLTVTDLSSKGTTNSRILLACRDAGGTLFRLEGSARIGRDPALDVILTAPVITLKNYRRLIAGRQALGLERATGSLSVGVNFRNGTLSTAGRLGFDQVTLEMSKGALLLKAALEFAGRYDTREDDASLDACLLTINDTVRLHASGTMHRVRKARKFAAKISLEQTDLGRLVMILPSEVRGGLTAAGIVSPAVFTMAGDAEHGVTSGKGRLQISEGEVTKGEEILARNLTAEVTLAGGESGWQTTGRISQGKGRGGEMLQALDARFKALFSHRLTIVRADIPSFSARLAGIPASGRIGYLPGSAVPLTATFLVRKAPVVAANPYLVGKKAVFSAGTLTLIVKASGKGPRAFKGEFQGKMDGIKGYVAGKQVAISEGAVDAEFAMNGGTSSASGKTSWHGSVADSGPVALTTSFGLADNRFSLSAGSVISNRSHIEFVGIKGDLPVPVKEGTELRVPLRLQLDGIRAWSGDGALSGLSGRIGMDYLSGQGGHRLYGNGQFAVADVSFRGKKLGSFDGGLECTKTGIIAQVGGRVLGGRMHGVANVDPFDQRKKTSFKIQLEGVKGTEITPFISKTVSIRISGGSLDTNLVGRYTAGEGVSCHVDASAVAISLSGNGGKPLLSGVGLRAVADLKEDILLVREGTISAGDDVAITFQGEVAHPFSPSRVGKISLDFPVTPLATLFHTFGALLPEKLRTAKAGGTLGSKGNIRLAAGNAIFDGELSLEKGRIDVPDQQFSLADATGNIPVSLVLAGDAGGTKQVRLAYRKENFASIRAALRQAARKGTNFTIGKVRFGPLELGETFVGIRAANGLTEITTFNSSLFEGTLLGAGYVHSGNKLRYAIDLTVGDLSLRALCDAYPNIKGYISGKVDGIISLYGEGTGLGSLRGFTDIWTRSGPDEKMLVSKEFLQKLAGRKLKGIFFRNDRPYDRGEIRGYLKSEYLTFEVLDIAHTNLFGIKDLSVSVAPVQNKISLMQLITSIRAAATRGKAAAGGEGAAPPPPPATDFKWEE